MTCEIPLQKIKGISTRIPASKSFFSVSTGANAANAQEQNHYYFNGRPNHANAQLYREFFHSVDGTQVVPTQLNRLPAKHFQGQTIARLLAVGYKLYTLEEQKFQNQKEDYIDCLHKEILGEKQDPHLGPGFLTSVDESLVELESLKKQRANLKAELQFLNKEFRQKLKGFKKVRKSCDEDALIKLNQNQEEMEKDFKSESDALKGKIENIEKSIHKANLHSEKIAENLEYFLRVYVNAIEESRPEKGLYPKYKPFSAILNYFWLIIKDRGDIEYYLNTLSSYKLAISPKEASDEVDNVFLPADGFEVDQRFNREITEEYLYQKQDLISWFFYSLEAASKPKNIVYSKTSLKHPYQEDHSFRFSDCVETSIRNFINAILWNRFTGDIDPSILKTLRNRIPLKEELIDYYDKYNNIEEHITQEARDDFTKIVSFLNQNEEEDQIEYRYSEGAEIRSGFENINKVLTQVFGVPFEELFEELGEIGVKTSVDFTDNYQIKLSINQINYHWSIGTGHSTFNIPFLDHEYAEKNIEPYKKLIDLFYESRTRDWHLYWQWLQLGPKDKVISYLLKHKQADQLPPEVFQDIKIVSNLKKTQKLRALISLNKVEICGEEIDELAEEILRDSSTEELNEAFDFISPVKQQLSKVFKKIISNPTPHMIYHQILNGGQLFEDNLTVSFETGSKFIEMFKDFLSEKDYVYIGQLGESMIKSNNPLFNKPLKYLMEHKHKISVAETMININHDAYWDLLVPVLGDLYPYQKLDLLKKQVKSLKPEFLDHLYQNKPANKVSYSSPYSDYLIFAAEHDLEEFTQLFNELILLLDFRTIQKVVAGESNRYKQLLKNTVLKIVDQNEINGEEKGLLREYYKALVLGEESERNDLDPNWSDNIFTKFDKLSDSAFLSFMSRNNREIDVNVFNQAFEKLEKEKKLYLISELLQNYNGRSTTQKIDEELGKLDRLELRRILRPFVKYGFIDSYYNESLIKKYRKKLGFFSTWF